MHEDDKLITAEEAMCRIGGAAGQLQEYVDAKTSYTDEEIRDYVDSNLVKMRKLLGVTDEDWDWVRGVQKDINVYLYDGNTLYFTHNKVTDHNGRKLTTSYVIKPTANYSGSPWSSNCQFITKIESDRIVAPPSIKNFFYDCRRLPDVSALANWNVSNVSDMSRLFYGCTVLTDISGLANWDTHSVTDMSYLFYSCASLANIDGLANWNTSAVTNMTSIFNRCSEITSFASINSWDVSKVTAHNTAFDNTTGTLPSWGTSW